MKEIKLMLLMLSVSITLEAQESYYNIKNKTQLKTLEHMIGKWEGSGWMMNKKTRSKDEFTQKEEINYIMDSTAIQVRGVGIANKMVVHDALGIITAGEGDSTFIMSSFLGDGRKGDYTMQVKEQHIEWSIPMNNRLIKYVITLSDTKWTEKGSIEMNGQWYPFFEMNLIKVSD